MTRSGLPLTGALGEEISAYCSAEALALGDGIGSKSPRSINELPPVDFPDLGADLDEVLDELLKNEHVETLTKLTSSILTLISKISLTFYQILCVSI